MKDKIVVRFGSGMLGLMDPQEFIDLIITDECHVESMTFDGYVWTIVLVRDKPEPEPEPEPEPSDYGNEGDYTPSWRAELALGMFDDECRMCGRERNLNHEGYCSSCWQVWNS